MLNKLDPRTIFYTTFIYIISLIFMRSYFDIIFILPLIILHFSIFSIEFSKIKKILKFSIGLFLSITLVNYFLMGRDLNYILVYLFRLMGIIFLTGSLVSSMNIRDLGFVLESFFTPLKIFKLPVDSISVITALAFKFIPLLKHEGDRILLAQKARGIDFDLMTLKEKIISIPRLFFPVIISGIQTAIQLSIAMEVRGFGNGEKRTTLREYLFSKKDYHYIIFCLVANLTFIFYVSFIR